MRGPSDVVALPYPCGVAFPNRSLSRRLRPGPDPRCYRRAGGLGCHRGLPTGEASGAELPARHQNLLFWGVHVLGAAREERLFGPLLRLLGRPDEELDVLLGEALTETLPKILAGTLDGDAASLHAAIADPAIDEIARMPLFGVLAFLTWEGRIDRAATHDFLIRFDESRTIRAGEAGGHGWETAIALLGFRDLAGRVKAAYADARLLGDLADYDWFEEALSQAEAAPHHPARFEAEGLGYIEDPVPELEALLALTEGDEEASAEEPIRNPLRDVGRNDLCPCGSGKKFKKCCLAA